MLPPSFNELARVVHETAREKGWWGDLRDYRQPSALPESRNFAEVLALIHSEVSEALEDWRNGSHIDEILFEYPCGSRSKYPEDDERNQGKPVGIPIELADIIIRVLDACAAWNIDIDEALRVKMKYNYTRPHRHGKKR